MINDLRLNNKQLDLFLRYNNVSIDKIEKLLEIDEYGFLLVVIDDKILRLKNPNLQQPDLPKYVGKYVETIEKIEKIEEEFEELEKFDDNDIILNEMKPVDVVEPVKVEIATNITVINETDEIDDEIETEEVVTDETGAEVAVKKRGRKPKES